MKSKKRMLTSAVAVILTSVLIFTACTTPAQPGPVETPPTPPPATTPATPPAAPPQVEAPIAAEPRQDPMRFVNALREIVPPATINTAPIIQDGQTLRVGLATATSFTGLLDPLFTTNTVDTDAASFIRGPGLFFENDDLTIGDAGMARIEEWCHDTQSILIIMQEEVFWHDGVQLTLGDLVFAYEVISHPDYTGTRWTTFVWNTVGTREFRAGEADYISGLVLSEDGMELRMYFEEWSPALPFFGFWTAPSPRHHLEHIPVADMAAHENVRANTLGFGPFILEEVVPGESHLFVRNENYWLGRPQVERVIFETVPSASAGMEIAAGNFDIIRGFAQSMYEHYVGADNFGFVGVVGRNSITGHSFVMGHFDGETTSVVREYGRKTDCVYLRRAIAMAIPHDLIGEQLFGGLLVPAVSNMALFHEPFFDPDLDFFRYNPEAAMQLLDEAGYAFGPDGFRRMPDGSELVIYMLYQNPATTAAEMRIELELQSIRDIGINAQLYDGRTVDFQVFGEMVNSHGPWGWDITVHGWSVGNNPNPNNLWGPYSVLNRPRYTSERFYYLLRDRIVNDERMWDPDFARETYWEWQRAMFDEVPFYPTTWSVVLSAVNNRVAGYSRDAYSDSRLGGNLVWHTVGVTAPTAYGQ